MFFFQAEDGIRDKLVTGVQTCALPIFEKALDLTRNRYQGGVASAVDVAQAETQLETTRAQAIRCASTTISERARNRRSEWTAAIHFQHPGFPMDNRASGNSAWTSLRFTGAPS